MMFASHTLASPARSKIVKNWEEHFRENFESSPLTLHWIIELTQEIVNGSRPRLTQPSLHTAAAPMSGATIGEQRGDVCEEEYYDEGKEHRENEEKTVMEMCATCGGIPFYWMQYKEDVMEEVEIKLKKIRGIEAAGNVYRKLQYCAYISARYDFLGKGNRFQIPSCVEDKIRRVGLDENGEYIGYINE